MNQTCRALARAMWHCLTAAALLVLAPVAVTAHDVPNEIVLNGFVKPDGQTLHVALRVPLIMLTSINLPKRGPGYLVLEDIGDGLEQAVMVTAREVDFFENGTALSHGRAAARISLPSDRSFESFESALASIEGPPLAATENVFWNQGYLDIHYEYPIQSENSEFALDFRLAAGLSGRLKLVVRYLTPDGSVRAYDVHGGFGRLALDPRWHQAAWSFVGMGFDHILDGIDHLLFLLCLFIPFGLRQFWTLAAVVTSFTVAHSATLIASALGLVPAGDWFPPLVESLIAVSILYMALENILAVMWNRSDRLILRWRWLVTGAFGLVHGFGFSFALASDLQFAGDHLLVSLLAFNLGVELGQLLALAVILPVVTVAFRSAAIRRIGVVIVSAFLAHTAWHWTLERAEALQYADWPEPTLGWLGRLGGIAALLALSGVVLWLVIRLAERRRGMPRRPAE